MVRQRRARCLPGVVRLGRPCSAEAYVRALWWALIVVSERSSIHYVVLPGIRRDDLLKVRHLVDDVASDELTVWWRPDGARSSVEQV